MDKLDKLKEIIHSYDNLKKEISQLHTTLDTIISEGNNVNIKVSTIETKDKIKSSPDHLNDSLSRALDRYVSGEIFGDGFKFKKTSSETDFVTELSFNESVAILNLILELKKQSLKSIELNFSKLTK